MVVPALDLREGRCVRLTRGDPASQRSYGDDPVEIARSFATGGAPLLHVVDLDAAFGQGSNARTIAAICAGVTVPAQVGGGLRTAAALEGAVEMGASRVVVGTAAAVDPSFVRDAVAAYGDRVVVAVDVADGRVAIDGWREQGPEVDGLIAELTAAGAPRFLVTSIAVDGTMDGPDLALYRRVQSLTDRPVMASGGVRTADDLRALAGLGLEAAIVGKALYEGALTLTEALAAAGGDPP